MSGAQRDRDVSRPVVNSGDMSRGDLGGAVVTAAGRAGACLERSGACGWRRRARGLQGREASDKGWFWRRAIWRREPSFWDRPFQWVLDTSGSVAEVSACVTIPFAMHSTPPPGYWQELPQQIGLGVPGNLVASVVTLAMRSLVNRYRSRKARNEFVRELERRSGVPELKARALADAFTHPQFAELLITGDSAIGNIVVSPMVPGSLDSDVANVASAFVERCRELAGPEIKAIRASHEEITRRMRALADSGISSDLRISTILRNLEDPDELPDRSFELAYLDKLVREPSRYEAIVAPAYHGQKHAAGLLRSTSAARGRCPLVLPLAAHAD